MRDLRQGIDMDWKQRTRISKDELDQLTAKAVSITTTIYNSFGTYDAILTMADGTEYRATTDSLNPLSDVLIRPISREDADRLMGGA